MLKLVGVCLLLAGGSGLSLILTREIKQELDTWVAVGDFLRYIRMHIDCFCTPKEEIFASFEHPLLEENGFLPALRQMGDVGLATEKSIKEEPLAALLYRFGKELGHGYREEQLAVCDFYLAALATQIEKRQRAFPQKVRVRRTVCLAGAMLVALLLL